MKRLNHLALTVASAAALGMALPAQAGEAIAGAKTPKDTARLSSPRYLEEHPELLNELESRIRGTWEHAEAIPVTLGAGGVSLNGEE